MSNKTKPIASLSLDLDDQWSYMKTHGDAGWEAFPSYLDILIPRVLAFLEERNLKITFFIVGQDAALEHNRDLLRAIADAGHEIGNHSFHHEPWLHLYSDSEIETEITRAHESIEQATGVAPVGFRGPGFSLSCAVLLALENLGYSYDASTYPNLLMPLARAYYFLTASLTLEEKERRKHLGGTFRDGLRTLKPFKWQLRNGGLTEIPVSTMPLLRVPIHVSYLMTLATISPLLANAYFNFALTLCRLRQVEPSILLHPTDFLTIEDTDALSFFPGLKMSREPKLGIVSGFIESLNRRFTLVGMKEHAQHVSQMPQLRLCEPHF